jgi:hypothetical protein
MGGVGEQDDSAAQNTAESHSEIPLYGVARTKTSLVFGGIARNAGRAMPVNSGYTGP